LESRKRQCNLQKTITFAYIPNIDRGPSKALATMLTTCDDHHERCHAEVLGHWHRCPGLSEGHSNHGDTVGQGGRGIPAMFVGELDDDDMFFYGKYFSDHYYMCVSDDDGFDPDLELDQLMFVLV
jgi:hypothetical protein